ncbi:MAG: MBL fold metallo-hydrolase [Dehalococcoidia bacterium]|nr:MBL fold metallo-hydrolase [Dehalococcoidia bacterium]
MLERKRGLPLVPEKLDAQPVTDGIRVVQNSVVGQDAHTAYTSWVTTPGGTVVIDPGNFRTSSMINKEIARESGKPVRYLIYSHAHMDHIGGAAAFADQHPRIIAHENTIPRLERYALTADYIRHINSIQFHFSIPPGRYSPVYPTETYRDEYRFELGGRTFELFHGKGETDDHTLVWVPELKAVFCGDLLEASFPNLGNPFKVMRYAREWAEALERALALDPDFAIGGDVVLVDRARIRELFKDNIEVLRFLEDSVVNAANEGKNLEQMNEDIQLPPHLENSPNLRQGYSRREFAIYSIWKRYCGYFDFSPSGLLPRPRREIAGVVRELVGSDETVLNKARELVESGQLQLALETLDIILKVDYEDIPARRVRQQILKKLTGTDTCMMSRNVWTHYLEEDEAFLAKQTEEG